MGVVFLGMPGPWAEDYREKSNFYTTKIGGLPDWPIPEMGIDPKLLACGICGEKLCLVAQVYAPMASPELMIEDRVLYILGCPMPKCGREPLSWRILRVQKCHVKTQPDGNSLKALPSEEKSASISKMHNLREDGFSMNGSGGLSDESEDEMDLQELRKAFSKVASVASHSRKQSGAKRSKSAKKGLVANPRVTDATIPVLPCFYIYSQKEPSSCDMVSVCDNYSSLSIKEDHQIFSDHENDEKWDGETYEYDRALGADRTYLKFKKQLDKYPQQCFRYSYGGNPLLALTSFVKPDTCKLCGSFRQYEMQLMPPLLYFLHQAADSSLAYSPEEWSWMTLIAYTCSKSCCPTQCRKENGCCCWYVVEEAIIIQDE